MTNQPLCPLCAARPRRIDGHERLRHSPQEGRGKNLFRCEVCLAFWSRTYIGSGQFAWALEQIDDKRTAAD